MQLARLKQTVLAALFIAASSCAFAATPGGSSANYAVNTDTLTSGGGRNSSVSYSNVADIGGLPGVITGTGYTVKSGYIAQLAQVEPTTLVADNITAGSNATTYTVNLTATVSSTGGSVNSGTVTFTVKNGATVIGSATTSGTVANGLAQVSYSIPGGTAPGSYQITAIYSGSEDFAASSTTAAGTLTINNNFATTTSVLLNFSIVKKSNFVQTVTLSALVIGSPSVNEGTVTFQILDNTQTLVGSAVTSNPVVGGNVSVMYSIPAAPATGLYTVVATYSGTSSYSASADQTKTFSVALADPPGILPLVIDRNPAVINTPVTITANAQSNSGLPLNYTFNLFNHGSPTLIRVLQDGSNASVTTTFTSEGDFDISVVVSDAFSSTAESVRLEVFPLGPNAGTTVPNILDASGANNPVDNLGIVVSTSQGGALNFDATTNGIVVRASGDTYTYTIPEQTATDPNRPLTGAKFTSQGIRVVQLDAVIGGIPKRSRLMLPISVPETDPSNAKTDTRTNKGIKSYSVKGKLKMAKTSTVAVSDIIEVSSGLLLTDMTTIEFGASSFRTKITVDTKGKVLSQTGSSHISKVKVTMPKLLDKTTHKTLPGATMTITFSLTGTGAELADSGLGEGGLASDGVGKVANPVKGTTIARQLQCCAIVAGMTYQSTLMILYSPDSDFGSISGRSAK